MPDRAVGVRVRAVRRGRVGQCDKAGQGSEREGEGCGGEAVVQEPSVVVRRGQVGR